MDNTIALVIFKEYIYAMRKKKLVSFFVRITREQRKLVRQAAREQSSREQQKVSEAEVVRRLITNILK